MDFDIVQEIREMVHGLGERKQRKDTMATIQSVLFKQMALVILQAHKAADRRGKKEISIEDVIFVLQSHKYTIKRMLKYFSLKENIHKLTAASNIEDQEQSANKAKKTKLTNDPAEQLFTTTPDFEFCKSTDLDLLNNLAENYIFKLNNSTKKTGIYSGIGKAVKQLNLDINVTTEEHFHNVTESRQIRINELAILLSPDAYVGFELCRSRSFHNKRGELLLNKVHRALPVDVHYKHQVRDIFLYLAKETVACLIDHVYENRKQFIVAESESINVVGENAFPSKSKKREAITVEEITAIVAKTWSRSLNDIHIPFRENDTFLNSHLIFDLYVNYY